MESPLDFFLTSLTLLSTGILVSVAATRILGASSSRRRFLAVGTLGTSVILAFALGTDLPAHALDIVKNTRVDILTLSPLELRPARIVLQSALVFSPPRSAL